MSEKFTEIPWKAFLHQANGCILISDGEDSVVYNSVAEFLIDEPGYALDDELHSMNYENKEGKVRHTGSKKGGGGKRMSQRNNDGNQPECPRCEGYIAKLAVYKTARKSREPALRTAAEIVNQMTTETGANTDALIKALAVWVGELAGKTPVEVKAELLARM